MKEVFARGLKIITSFTSERSQSLRFTMWRHNTTGTIHRFTPENNSSLLESVAPQTKRQSLLFSPYYKYSTEDYQTVTVFGEKVSKSENDIKYYEKWFKQVVSFSQEYLRNQELMLSVSD